MRRYDIWPFEEWKVLSEHECASLRPNQTSIWVVQVMVGWMRDDKNPKTTPIIRWLPRKDFYKEKKRGKSI